MTQRPLPRLVVATSAVVLVVATVITLVGAWRTGVSWDESYHVVRLRNLFDHGWYLLDQDLDGDAPGTWVNQRYVYSPVAALVLHAWTAAWGAEPWSGVSASAHAYALRHVGVALISFVGVGATAGIVRLLSRRWDAALLAAAVLVSVPTWTGHAMFNVKDIPVATGYTLVTLGCAAFLARPPSTRRPSTHVVAAVPALALGITLAVGTRPGIWPGLGLAGFLTVVVLARRGAWGRIGLVGIAVAAAYVALVLAYPRAMADPLTWMPASVGESSDFGNKPGARWYLPVFLTVELPTLWLLTGAWGAGVALRRARDPLLALVLAQTFTLPVLAIVHGSNVYTGIRQFLFAAPGLAVLTTVALLWLLERRRVAATGLAFGGLVLPVVGAAMLFPYVYTFESAPANLLAPILAEHDRRLEVQTDYWRTSVRELAPQIPRDAFVTCSPELRDDVFRRHSNETTDDCASFLISPLAAYDDRRTLPWTGSATEFLAVRQGNDTIAENCTELASVERRLWWRVLTMSTVSRCDLVVEPYPGPSVDFDGAGAGANLLLGGWRLHPSEPAIGLRAGGTGQLGFTTPHAGPLTISGVGHGFTGLTVSGVDAPLGWTGDTFEATVTIPADSPWGSRLVLSFAAGPTGAGLSRLWVR